MATAGKLGAVYAPTVDVNDDPDTATTTDAAISDGDTLSNEYIDPDSVEITYNNVSDEGKSITINYITGDVSFDETFDGTIDVSYTYLVSLEQVGGFFEWNVDEEAGLEESPEFGDEVITHTQTLDSWSGSASKYFDVDNRFNDWVGTKVVLAFYIDTDTLKRFEAWGIIGDKSTSTPVDTLVEEDISIEGQTRLRFRE